MPSQNLSTPYISNENNFHFVKFLYFNARSLKNKFLTLNLLLKSGIYEFILVTETWLNENTYDAEIVSDSEYCIIRHDRLGKVGGGVAIIFKRHIKVIQINIPERFNFLELLVADLHFENEKYRLVLCYRPPNLNYDDSMLLFEAISSMCSSTRHTVLLTGDFNLPDIKWNKREFFSEGTLPYEFIKPYWALSISSHSHFRYEYT